MGNAVVNAQFHHFGVHHNEFDILRARLVQEANDDGIHAHGFTGTGGTGNEHMGHFCNVAHNAVAANILAHRERGFGLCSGKLRRVHHLPQRDRGHGAVGDLNAHNGDFAGNGGNTNAGSTQAQGDVIGAGGQLAQPYALIKLYLIPCDTGAPGDIDNMGINAETCQSLVKPSGILPHFLRSVGTGPNRAAQKFQGREAVGLGGCLLALGDFRRHLAGRLRSIFGGDLAGFLPGVSGFGGRNFGGSRFFRLLRRRLPALYKGRHFLGNGFRLPAAHRLLRFQLSSLLLHRDALGGRIHGGINIQVNGIHHIRSPGGGTGGGKRGFLLGPGLWPGLNPGLLFGLGRGLGFLRQGLGHRLRGLFAALLLHALVGQVVHHRRRRLHIVVFLSLIPQFSGPVGNGPDDAGNGDLHGAKEGQYGSNAQNQVGNHIAAGPAQQHGKPAAQHAAGAAIHAPCIKVGNHGKALRHALALHCQMVNAATEQHKGNKADAAHGGGVFSSKGLDKEQVQKGGDEEIKSNLAKEAQNHGFHGSEQSTVRIHRNDQKQYEQDDAEEGKQDIGGQTTGKILIAFFYFLRSTLLRRGRFAAGFPSGGFGFGFGGGFIRPGRRLLLCH